LIQTQPAGYFDTLVLLALKFNWTPAQVMEMPPAYINELMMAIEAKAEHDEKASKK